MDIATQPRRIAEPTPSNNPEIIGDCDASGTVMGGVFLVPNKDDTFTPSMWRKPFEYDICESMISYNNTRGNITNSDHNLSGDIAHHNVISQKVDVRKRTIHILYGNIDNM